MKVGDSFNDCLVYEFGIMEIVYGRGFASRFNSFQHRKFYL